MKIFAIIISVITRQEGSAIYKCLECGHIFDDGEESVTRDYHDEIPGGFYEELTSCPVCGGEYEKAVRCERCGGAFLQDELYSAYCCDECLKEALTADSFLDFSESDLLASSDTSVHIVEDFMITTFYDLDSRYLQGSSKEFRKLMISKYTELSDAHNSFSKYAGKDDGFVNKIWTYLKEENMLQDFAEYLEWKEAKR